jgi:hypothetical protein
MPGRQRNPEQLAEIAISNQQSAISQAKKFERVS